MRTIICCVCIIQNSRHLSFAILYGRQIKSNAEFCLIREKSDLISNLHVKHKIQDGDNVYWRHRPPAAPPPVKCISSCREGQRLSTKSKIVSKYCNISKTQGRGSIKLLALWLCLYFRGLRAVFPFLFNSSSRSEGYNFVAIRIARGSAEMRLSAAFYRRSVAHISLN